MCRQEIPADFVERPQLVEVEEPTKEATDTEEEYQWFYEGRNGNIFLLYLTLHKITHLNNLKEMQMSGEKNRTYCLMHYVYVLQFFQFLLKSKS